MATPPASPTAARGPALLDFVGDPRRGAWLLLAIALVLFAPALLHRATLDSQHFLVEDLRVREFRVFDLLTKGYWNLDLNDPAIAAGAGDLWRPLTLLWMSLWWQLSGPEQRALAEPVWLNAANIALHALSVVLRFWLFVRLLGSRPRAGAIGFFAALWLAVHPIATEAVATQVGAAEGLAAVLGTAALLAWHRWQHDGERRHAVWFAASLFLGLLAKENAIAIAVLAPLGSFVLLHRSLRQSAAVAAVAAAPIAIWVLLRFWVSGALASVKDPVLAGYPPLAALQTALAGIGWYDLPALLWPFRLLAFVSHQALWPPAGFGDWRVLLGIVAIAAVTFATVVAWRRDRTAAFGLLFFAIAFFPVSNLVVQIGALAATRFLYLPMTGLALALAIGVARLCRSPAAAPRLAGRIAAAASLALAVVATIREVPVWASDVTLQRAMLERAEDSMAGSALATALVPEIQAAMARRDKAAATELQAEAKRAFDLALAAPRPQIPGTGAVPEDLLELAYKTGMSRAIAAMQWDNDLDAAMRFGAQIRDVARAGAAQSEQVHGQAVWTPLESDAECLIAEIAVQGAQRQAAGSARRDELLALAEEHIAAARKVAPQQLRPDEQHLRVLQLRGDAAATAREYEAVYERVRPRVRVDSAAARIAMAWSTELEHRGRGEQALAVALETLVAGRDRFAEAAPFFDYGSRGMKSKDPAVQANARAALEVFLERADARDGSKVEAARRLLGRS